MHQRCNNPKRKDYKWYGAKGVSVCEEWDEYSNFKEWALSSGYEDTLTIDRIDAKGKYEPSNCRWATMAEQRLNATQLRNVTINGETMCLKHWCNRYGISYDMVRQRIAAGMNDVDALLTPSRRTLNAKRIK